MTERIVIIALFNLISSLAIGQKPSIMKEIRIVHDYSSNYSERKAQIDTSVVEYYPNGQLKEQYQNPYVTIGKIIYKDSVVTINASDVLIHKSEYYSDSSVIEIYTRNFNDSIIEISIRENDTIRINKQIYSNGNLIRSHFTDFRPDWFKHEEIKLYDKKTRNFEIATVITTFSIGGKTDTTRVENDFKKRIYKTLVYNKEKDEWFVKEKTKERKKKKVLWNTFYHDYHKMYFTIKTTIKYNKYGLPISEIIYDKYLKEKEKKTIYRYEYYDKNTTANSQYR